MSAPAPYHDWNWHVWRPGRELTWHGHAFLQAIHVLEGELLVDWGQGWRVCGPGDVHVLPPHTTHRLLTRRGHRQFGLNWATRGRDRGLHAALLEVATLPGIWHAPDLPDRVAPLRQPAAADGLAQARCGHLLDAYAFGLHDLLGGQRLAPWMRLREELRRHLDRPVQVTELATAAGLSRAHAQRLCRRHHGCGLAALHARWRLQAAARHLTSQTGTIAACAEAFGFADQAQFSRAFKRVMGLTPTAYRTAHRSHF